MMTDTESSALGGDAKRVVPDGAKSSRTEMLIINNNNNNDADQSGNGWTGGGGKDEGQTPIVTPVGSVTVQADSNRLITTQTSKQTNNDNEVPERENPFHAGGELQEKADFIVSHSDFSPTRLSVVDPDNVERTQFTFDDTGGEPVEAEVKAFNGIEPTLQTAELCQLPDDSTSKESGIDDVGKVSKPDGKRGLIKASSITDSKELLEAHPPGNKEARGSNKEPNTGCKCCTIQ